MSEDALTSRIKAAGARAVGDNGRDQRVIRTVHGRGYRFVADLAGPASSRQASGGGELHAMIDELRSGRGRAVLVVAPPGAGSPGAAR